MCSSDRSKCYSCNVVQRKNNNHNSNNRSGKSGKSCKGSPSHCLLKLDLNENTIRSSSSSSGSSESSPRKRSSKNNNHQQQKNNFVCCEERISHSSFRHSSSASSTSSSSTSSSCPLHHISSSCSRTSPRGILLIHFFRLSSNCFLLRYLQVVPHQEIRNQTGRTTNSCDCTPSFHWMFPQCFAWWLCPWWHSSYLYQSRCSWRVKFTSSISKWFLG